MTTVLEKYELKHPALSVVESDQQNALYTAKLLELMKQDDISADDRKYIRLLSSLIDAYESRRYSFRDAKPHEVIAELISQNNLRQKDLMPLLGTESVVSEIVNGKRPLSNANIVKLSQKFNVSAAAFFPKVKKK